MRSLQAVQTELVFSCQHGSLPDVLACQSHSHSTLPWFVFKGYLTQSRPASHMPNDSIGIPGHPHVTAAEGNADAVETCTDVKITSNKRRNGANSWKLAVNSKTPRLRAVINSLPGHVAPQTPRTSRVWSSADNFTESGWRICFLKHVFLHIPSCHHCKRCNSAKSTSSSV